MEADQQLKQPLTDIERTAMIRTFDELIPSIPMTSAKAAERELEELRDARRSGGRLTPADRT
ncbi:MAG TPA: hypothetical protein VMF91_00060 [Bryobacteraceae bacterium]|nr:hypothetical protein [Bryobacteraceae bacterium]